MLRLVTKNFGWKLLSLALAFGLWLAIVGEPEMATSVSVPIQYTHIPPDYEISSDIPERVHLEVQGPTVRVQNLKLGGAAVILDLRSVNRQGERSFTIDDRTLNLPAGIRLVRAVPSQLRIRFDRKASREVPVQVRFSTPPPEGYRVVRRDARPQTVRLIGPEARLRRIDFAETDAIDLSALVSTSEFHVNAFVDDPHIRFETSPRVTVRVVVERIPESKDLPASVKKTIRN